YTLGLHLEHGSLLVQDVSQQCRQLTLAALGHAPIADDHSSGCCSSIATISALMCDAFPPSTNTSSTNNLSPLDSSWLSLPPSTRKAPSRNGDSPSTVSASRSNACGNTAASIAPVASASVSQAIRSPFFVVRRRRLVTIAPTLAGALSGRSTNSAMLVTPN